ncbi:MAG: UPF0182 family protein, partial [Cyanobacteria bacterium]|nr:UPF0182 family protein [Cyanobacteriota bacterium]
MWEKALRSWGGWPWVMALLLVALLVQVGLYVGAEGLWFVDVGHWGAFRLRIGSQLLLGILGALISLILLGGNLWWAYRLPAIMASELSASPQSQAGRAGLGLRSLLSLSFGLCLLISLQLLYLGQVFSSYWSWNASVYNPTPPLPLWAKPAAIQALVTGVLAQPWQLVAVAVVAIALLLVPRFSVTLAAWVTSIGLGGVLAEQWTKVLPALNPVPFNRVDPLFGRDISFYVLRLPCLEVLLFWGVSLIFFALVSVTLVYLLAGNSLSQGRFLGFTPAQQRHLYGLGGGLLLSTSLSHWLGRYQILYSQQGVVYGASYTDIHVSLPVYTVLGTMSLLLGLGLL